MSEDTITEILKAINAGLAVFESHQGRLTGSEISVKSMLFTLRFQLNDQLERTRGLGSYPPFAVNGAGLPVIQPVPPAQGDVNSQPPL